MPCYALECHTCNAICCFFSCSITVRFVWTFLWIFVLVFVHILCSGTLLFLMNVNGALFFFRFLPLSVHLWHREPHQPIQHQWNTSAPCSPHLHPAERAPVCGGGNQHQWGEGEEPAVADSHRCLLFLNDAKTDFDLYDNTQRANCRCPYHCHTRRKKTHRRMPIRRHASPL